MGSGNMNQTTTPPSPNGMLVSLTVGEIEDLVGRVFDTKLTGLTQTRLLTVEELAEKLQVSKSWVYENQRRLKAIHVGSQLRFDYQVTLRALAEASD